jgi:hypothetical protein
MSFGTDSLIPNNQDDDHTLLYKLVYWVMQAALGPNPPSAVTITDVSPFVFDPTTQLQVTWTPPSDGWNHFYMEVYEDAGLTILNQVLEGDTLVGTFSAVVGSAPPALDPNTQYWIRMKVREGTGPYSDWSNTGTGTTDNNDPLAGLLQLRLEDIDASSISTWVNTGTTAPANNATQAVAGMQPTFIAASADFNGQPCLRFDATNDGMATGYSLTNPYTIIFVARALDTSIQASNRTINSQDHNSLISINRVGAAVYNEGIIKDSTGADGTTAHVISLAIGAESHVYIDGVDVTQNTNFVGDWGRISIGNVGSNAEPANADIAAIGVFLGVDDTTRQLVEATWKAKYGTP